MIPKHGTLRIALKCHTTNMAHTIFATALPWGKIRKEARRSETNCSLPPDVSDARLADMEFMPGPHGQYRLALRHGCGKDASGLGGLKITPNFSFAKIRSPQIEETGTDIPLGNGFLPCVAKKRSFGEDDAWRKKKRGRKWKPNDSNIICVA